jgi:hypothetical protein
LSLIIISSSHVKFIIVDFEFASMPNKNWALINGSMINSLDKYQPLQLQKKLKLLTNDGKYNTLHKSKHYDQIERFAVRCFSVKKPEVLSHLLGNLSSSRNYKGEPTLTTTID